MKSGNRVCNLKHVLLGASSKRVMFYFVASTDLLLSLKEGSGGIRSTESQLRFPEIGND